MDAGAIRADSCAFVGSSRRRAPLTLWLGLGIMLVCEGLLFSDVLLTGRGPVHTNEQLAALPAARGLFGQAARWMAFNMTAVVWVGYVIFLEGVLTLQQGKSPLRARPHHFAFLFLASVVIWCVFDWINFYYIKAWRYVGVPSGLFLTELLWGYLLAFGTIVPGMLMSGQVLMNLGLFNWARTPKWRLPRWGLGISFVVGLAMFVWPLVHWDPITNLTLWTGLVFLLDPINLLLGRPSMWRDWQNGWLGRTLACFAGGLMCGFLWEFWNYFALTKWTYHLPFLGSLEQYKYFEMPLLGLLGFLPFGIECWIMWQLMRVPLDGLVEPLAGEKTLL